VGPRQADRRVERTVRSLHRALVTLLLEKRFDEITVQDVLDRADVGRSTFYAHFHGKDDLLRASFENLFRFIEHQADWSGSAGRVLPVRELFEHVREFRGLHRALTVSGKIDLFQRSAVAHLSAAVEKGLAARVAPGRRLPVPLPVLANHVAAALMAMLDWWVRTGMPHSPERMDASFHALVMPAVRAATAATRD
jgi:AcrR family transcriptional regulator